MAYISCKNVIENYTLFYKNLFYYNAEAEIN